MTTHGRPRSAPDERRAHPGSAAIRARRSAMRMRSLLIVALLAAFLAGAGSWWVGSVLVAPVPRSVGPPPPELAARPVVFESASGSALSGWAARGREGGGAVVLAHSVRSDRRAMVARAAFLRDAGYSVLLFDQQAHGESAGAMITFGHLESRDARAAVSTARALWPGERVGYLGVSQGGAAALLGAEPLAVDALVVESVYPSLPDAVTNRVAIRLGPLARSLAPLLSVQSRLRLGVAAGQIAPIRGIAHVRAPLLLIAGGRDRHTTIAESQRMFAAAPAPKELWVLPDAAHQDFHELEPGAYERRVLGFFARHLRAPRHDVRAPGIPGEPARE